MSFSVATITSEPTTSGWANTAPSTAVVHDRRGVAGAGELMETPARPAVRSYAGQSASWPARPAGVAVAGGAAAEEVAGPAGAGAVPVPWPAAVPDDVQAATAISAAMMPASSAAGCVTGRRRGSRDGRWPSVIWRLA